MTSQTMHTPDSTRVVLDFIALVARTKSVFRKTHIFAEATPALIDVSTEIGCIDLPPSPLALPGEPQLKMSISLSAELREVLGPDKQAIGMDLDLSHGTAGWLAEASVAWYSNRYGNSCIDSREAAAASIEELSLLIPPLVQWMSERFKEEVQKLPARPKT